MRVESGEEVGSMQEGIWGRRLELVRVGVVMVWQGSW